MILIVFDAEDNNRPSELEFSVTTGTHLNFHTQLLGHSTHPLIPNDWFLPQTEQNRRDTLHGQLQCSWVPCIHRSTKQGS